MCGRYVSPEEAEIERFWHIGRHNSNPFARHFNVSPTSIIPILRLDRSTGEIELVNARWGLIPTWWKEPKPPRTTHNARSEEAATKPDSASAIKNPEREEHPWQISRQSKRSN
jgi:putative SOS response-associated peptidase YedK